MAKDSQPQQQASGKVEKIVRANFNTTVVVPGLGPNQTISVDEHSPIGNLWPHRLGLAIQLKNDMARPDGDFYVVPWANVGNMKVSMVVEKPKVEVK